MHLVGCSICVFNFAKHFNKEVLLGSSEGTILDALGEIKPRSHLHSRVEMVEELKKQDKMLRV